MRERSWKVPGSKFRFVANTLKAVKVFKERGIHLKQASQIFARGQVRIQRPDWKDNHSGPTYIATGMISNKAGKEKAVTVAFQKNGKEIRIATAYEATRAEQKVLESARQKALEKKLSRPQVRRGVKQAERPQRNRNYAEKGKKALQNQKEQARDMAAKLAEKQKEWKQDEKREKEYIHRKLRQEPGRNLDPPRKEYYWNPKTSPWKDNDRDR